MYLFTNFGGNFFLWSVLYISALIPNGAVLVFQGRRLLDKVECLNLACDKVVFGVPHWCWLIGKRRKIRYREICKISGYTVLLYIKTA
jgi:hypothetical protein